MFINQNADNLLKSLQDECSKKAGATIRTEHDDWLGDKIIIECNNKSLELKFFNSMTVKKLNDLALQLAPSEVVDCIGFISLENEIYNFTLKGDVIKFFRISKMTTNELVALSSSAELSKVYQDLITPSSVKIFRKEPCNTSLQDLINKL